MYNGQVPYYPVAMGYPDYMYQQYPFYALSANQFGAPQQPYMTNGMNGYAPRKKNSKHGYNNYNGYKPYSHSNSPEGDESEKSSEPEARKEIIQEDSTKQPLEASAKPSAEHTPVELKTAPSPDHGQIKTETAQPETAAAEAEDQKQSDLPLLFNISLQSYQTERPLAVAHQQTLLASKNARLDAFAPLMGHMINPHGVSRIIDHNSDTQYLHRVPAAQTPNDNDTYDSKSEKVLNWAAVLQSTATKKTKKPAAKVVATVPETKLVPLTPTTEDSAQPLGMLVMRMLFDPEFVLDNCATFPLRPRGLTNTGNICYMNAVLQCLLYCEPFNRVLRLIDEKAIGSLGKSSTPILDATLGFVKDFVGAGKLNGSVNSEGIVVGRPLSPEGLYMKLIESSKFQHLKWGQQEDAEEFLGYYLDGLHEEFVAAEAALTSEQVETLLQAQSAEVKANIKNAVGIVRSQHEDGEETELDDDDGWAEVGSGKRVSKKRVVQVEPSPITSIFGGRFRSVLTVPRAKESQSITVDPFRCMLIDISNGDVHTIEDALWLFNEVEKIPFKTEPGVDVVARKQTYIDQLPEVLILQLKRFSYQHDGSTPSEPVEDEVAVGMIEKVMKDVRYGLDLTVPVETLSAAARASTAREYRLIGVIYHHGRNAEGGHYTCDVLRDRSDGTWLRIDDTAVETVDAAQVCAMPEARDKSAYILMYQRK